MWGGTTGHDTEPQKPQAVSREGIAKQCGHWETTSAPWWYISNFNHKEQRSRQGDDDVPPMLHHALDVVRDL